MIQVLYACIGECEPDNLLNYFQQILPDFLNKQALKYRDQKDVLRSLSGKYLLRQLLTANGYDKSLLNDIESANGKKPVISPNFDFNISHSGNIVVCAFSTSCKVGIDIEQMRPIDPTKFAKVLKDSELKTITGSENTIASFFNTWTQKESVMKATGTGFKISPKKILIDNNIAQATGGNELWYLYPVMINSKYVCHVCSNQIALDIEILKKPINVKSE